MLYDVIESLFIVFENPRHWSPDADSLVLTRGRCIPTRLSWHVFASLDD
jgi:hypothetical protein